PSAGLPRAHAARPYRDPPGLRAPRPRRAHRPEGPPGRSLFITPRDTDTRSFMGFCDVVLVVDDDAAQSRPLLSALEKAGFTPALVVSGDEAIRLIIERA